MLVAAQSLLMLFMILRPLCVKFLHRKPKPRTLAAADAPHAMRDYEAHDAAQPSRARARPAASRLPLPRNEIMKRSSFLSVQVSPSLGLWDRIWEIYCNWTNALD